MRIIDTYCQMSFQIEVKEWFDPLEKIDTLCKTLDAMLGTKKPFEIEGLEPDEYGYYTIAPKDRVGLIKIIVPGFCEEAADPKEKTYRYSTSIRLIIDCYGFIKTDLYFSGIDSQRQLVDKVRSAIMLTYDDRSAVDILNNL